MGNPEPTVPKDPEKERQLERDFTVNLLVHGPDEAFRIFLVHNARFNDKIFGAYLNELQESEGLHFGLRERARLAQGLQFFWDNERRIWRIHHSAREEYLKEIWRLSGDFVDVTESLLERLKTISFQAALINHEKSKQMLESLIESFIKR